MDVRSLNNSDPRNLRAYLIALCCFIFLLSSFYLYKKYQYTDYAYFGGDTWEYQSIGVNLSLGKGYQSWGVEDLDVYKFSLEDSAKREGLKFPISGGDQSIFQKRVESFHEHAGYRFYRTPGYPVFIAAIYKIFGISPFKVKMAQVLMLSLAACFMPFIGYLYWTRMGIISGSISSLVFLRYFCPDPSVILSEPIVLFGLVLWIFPFRAWENKSTPLNTFILGVSTGLLLLIKGNIIFVPLLFIIYVWILARKLKHIPQVFSIIAIFFLGLFLMILPWSMYASSKGKEVVLLSTQGRNILLDGNNEDTIRDGKWSKVWRFPRERDRKYLYNRLDDAEYGTLKKYLIFMFRNKHNVPTMLKNKIIVVFGNKRTCSLIFLMSFYYLAVAFKWFGLSYKNHSSLKYVKIPIFPLIFFLNILFVILIGVSTYRFIIPFSYFFLFPAMYIFVYLVKRSSDKLIS